jgi:hypothetical protein
MRLCLLRVAFAAGLSVHLGEIKHLQARADGGEDENNSPIYYVVAEGQLQEDKSKRDPTIETVVTDQPDFGGSGSQASSADSAANKGAAGPLGSASISTADSSCVSISPVASDYWCATTCETGNGASCPEDVCKCANKAVKQAAGTKEQQDVQKQIQQKEVARRDEERRRQLEDAKRVAENDAAVRSTWNAAAGVTTNPDTSSTEKQPAAAAHQSSKKLQASKEASHKSGEKTQPAAAKGGETTSIGEATSIVTDQPDFAPADSKSVAAKAAPEAKHLAAASVSTADSSCVSISPAASDYWCATNCETGGGSSCPETMCECGVKKHGGADEEYISRQKNEADRAEEERAKAEKERMEEDARRVAADDKAREASWASTDPSAAQNNLSVDSSQATKEVVVTGEPDFAQGTSNSKNADSAPKAQPLATASISTADSNCVSISSASSDYWCATNCLTGSCPASMCKCGDGKR